MFPQEPLGKSGVPNIDWLIKPNCLASPGSPQYNQFKWLQQRSGWLPSLVCPTPASPCSSQVAGSVTNGAAVAHITGTCKGRVSEVAPRGTWRNPRNLRHDWGVIHKDEIRDFGEIEHFCRFRVAILYPNSEGSAYLERLIWAIILLDIAWHISRIYTISTWVGLIYVLWIIFTAFWDNYRMIFFVTLYFPTLAA